LKKLNLFVILVFLISLNFIGKSTVGFVSENSMYNFSINLITALFLAVLVLVILRASAFKTHWMIYSLILSQGLAFYFLFSQPRLFDKIMVAGFYFSGVFYKTSTQKKAALQAVSILILFPLLFELSGMAFFGRHFIFLNLLRNFLIMAAGVTGGLLLKKG